MGESFCKLIVSACYLKVKSVSAFDYIERAGDDPDDRRKAAQCVAKYQNRIVASVKGDRSLADKAQVRHCSLEALQNQHLALLLAKILCSQYFVVRCVADDAQGGDYDGDKFIAIWVRAPGTLQVSWMHTDGEFRARIVSGPKILPKWNLRFTRLRKKMSTSKSERRQR